MTDFAQDFPPAIYRCLVEDEYGFRSYVTVTARDRWEALKVCKDEYPELSPLSAALWREAVA